MRQQLLPQHSWHAGGRRAIASTRTMAFLMLLASASPGMYAAEHAGATARASIQAADASRHIAALADDAFEGREGGSRGGRAAGAYIVSAIEKLGLKPAGDAGTFYQRFGSMRNILCLLPGSDPAVAHEAIVVCAHYDHVGYGNANNSHGPTGFIHNGADDNASGVAGVIEVAEAFQHLPSRPRRSILFAFWDGEEKGLLGSYHFLRSRPAAVAPLAIVFSVNIDMIGRLRGERLEIFGARTAEGLRAALVQANAGANLEFIFDWKIAEDSDHYAFITARIPTVMFHTGLHAQYHRPSDDMHLINMHGVESVARLTLDFVSALADDPAAARPFRAQSRSESSNTRKALEQSAPAAVIPAERGRWGIGTRADPGEPSAPVVVRITPQSPAANGGLSLGDRVLAIDGVAVSNQSDMVNKLRIAGPNTVLDIDRKGRMIQLKMTTDR